MKALSLRLPRQFFYDHKERDLPTPEILHLTIAYVFVDGDDPAIGELINDAEYYADPNGANGGSALRRSAIATISAYKNWCEKVG
jgi:hypothetical protein